MTIRTIDAFIFGKNLRRLRKERDLSMDAFCDQFNKKFDASLNKSTVSRYENGEQEPMISTVSQIANFFNVEQNYLVGAANWRPDILEDYNNARTDEDRKNILEKCGVPENLRSKYHRLLDAENRKSAAIMSKRSSDAIDSAYPISFIPVLSSVPAGYPAFAMEEIAEEYEAAPVSAANAKDYFYLRVEGDSMIGARIHDGDKVLVKIQPYADPGQIVVCSTNGDDATLKRYREADGFIILQPENSKYQPIILAQNDFAEGAHIIGVVQQVMFKP